MAAMRKIGRISSLIYIHFATALRQRKTPTRLKISRFRRTFRHLPDRPHPSSPPSPSTHRADSTIISEKNTEKPPSQPSSVFYVCYAVTGIPHYRQISQQCQTGVCSIFLGQVRIARSIIPAPPEYPPRALIDTGCRSWFRDIMTFPV